MKKLYTLLFAVSIAAVTANAATQIVNHKIKNGETLYTVAHQHHSTIEEVRKLNGIKKGEILKIGRVVKVPRNTYNSTKKTALSKKSTASKKAKVVKTSTIKHKIKNGETLYTVAHQHHSTIEEVRKLNGIKKGEILKIGRVVKVPRNTYNPTRKTALSKKSTAPKKAKVVKSPTTKHKIKIVKSVTNSKKSNKILQTALTKHAKPLATKRVKRKRRVTIDDIFFKSAQPNVMAFSGFGINKKAKNIIQVAKQKLGRKYVWGAVGKRGTFDCSGFTSCVYKENGISIPRTSINQSKYGKFVSRENLKKGDLIFFDTSKRRKGYVNHVGIYLGDGKFIHASSAKKKVVISNLSNFYAQRYKGARRPS